jgi:hypothetical protein
MTEKQNPEDCLKSLVSVNKVLQNSTQKEMSGYGQYRYFKKIRKDGFGAFRIVPYTRKRAIRYYCQECVGFNYQEVVDCTMRECPLFPYRLGKIPKEKTAQDRSKAIRNHCLECCSGDTDYISNCPSSLCPVHPFRLPGYQTDNSSLIPATQIENFPEYENGFEDLKEKIAV